MSWRWAEGSQSWLLWASLISREDGDQPLDVKLAIPTFCQQLLIYANIYFSGKEWEGATCLFLSVLSPGVWSNWYVSSSAY